MSLCVGPRRRCTHCHGGFRYYAAFLFGRATGALAIIPKVALAALPGLLVFAGYAVRKQAFPPRLIPFWVCGTALFLSEWQRPDMAHLAFGCPILLLTLIALLSTLTMPSWLSNVALASIMLFGVTNLLAFLPAVHKTETRRGTIYSRQKEAAIQFIEQHTKPGDEVFVYPYRPLYNFLSDTQNPSRFSYFIYGWHTKAQFEEAIKDLETKRVRYVLLDADVTKSMRAKFVYYRVPSASEQAMEQYVLSHYRDVAFANGFRILERNSDVIK